MSDKFKPLLYFQSWFPASFFGLDHCVKIEEPSKAKKPPTFHFAFRPPLNSPSRPAWSMATVFEVTTSFGTFCWNFFRDSIMQVADRPGDISILTHIFVSDNRTVVLDGPGAWPPCSWISALNHHTYLFYDNNHQSHKIFILFVFWANKHLFCLCYCLLVLFFILLLRLYLYKNEKVATVRTQVASAYFDTWKPSCNFLLYLVG